MIAKYRQNLPQLADDLFLSDGGIETTLIYQYGFPLPYFAAFDLLRTAAGREALRHYFRSHATIARETGVGFVLESATWRASADWATKLGYGPEELAAVNHEAIVMLHQLRAEFETDDTRVVISGCIGPRGDGYKADARMTPDDAEAYHRMQVTAFAKAGADLVTAITMTHTEEAMGIVQACRTLAMPVVISFTTETDGRLPSGETLQEAITKIDAVTGFAPIYYMINCAHPTHFAESLSDSPWGRRVRGIRANASTKCHAELDACTELDAGDCADFAARYARLKQEHPQLTVFGGCCGTDHRHMRAIAAACIQTPVMRTRRLATPGCSAA